MTTRRWMSNTSCTLSQSLLHACLHPGEQSADEPMLALCLAYKGRIVMNEPCMIDDPDRSLTL